MIQLTKTLKYQFYIIMLEARDTGMHKYIMVSFLKEITVWLVRRSHTPTWDTINHMLVIYTREDDGTPLPYSCLESPMDGGAW